MNLFQLKFLIILSVQINLNLNFKKNVNKSNDVNQILLTANDLLKMINDNIFVLSTSVGITTNEIKIIIIIAIEDNYLQHKILV
jgi:hypothetical protein